MTTSNGGTMSTGGGGHMPSGRGALPDARRAEIILVVVTAAWGLTFPLIKGALADATPMAFIALRFTLATLVLAPFLGGPMRITSWAAARAGILLGALFAAGWAFQTFGLTITTAGKSAFLTGTNVLFVPLLSWRLEHERPPLASVAGALLAVCGIALLTHPENMRFNLGDLLTLGCAVVFALEIVVLQILSRRHGSWALMWPAIATTAVLAGLAAAFETPRIAWTPRLGAALAFTGIVATAIALVLHMRWQKETTAVRAGVIYSLEPVFALLFAAALFGERMPGLSLAGGAAIVSGVIVSELGHLPRGAGSGAKAAGAGGGRG